MPDDCYFLAVYRGCLRLCPEDFRSRYGADLLATVAAREGDWRTLGFAARQRRRVRELVALMRSAYGMRAARPDPDRSPGRGHMMDDLITDVRHAVRRLGKAPAFTAVAAVTLALGIGASTAIFSLVNGILVEPLPFPDADRLVTIWTQAPGLGIERFELSDAMYLTYRERSSSLEEVAVWGNRSRVLTGGDEPVRVEGAEVTPSFFSVLQVQPILGRAFTEEEGGADGDPVVILSAALWASRFGSDPDILGRRIEVSGVLREVVGVMAADFRYPATTTRLWTPFIVDPDALFGHSFSYRGIGRLRADLPADAAETAMARAIAEIVEVAPGQFTDEMMERTGIAPLLTTLKEDVVGDIGQVLWILMGTVGLVLLIAGANVAKLFLVRAEGSQREVAVRSALGAGRGRVTRFYLAESAVLGVVGALLGVALAAAIVRVVRALDPGTLPRLEEVSINAPVLAFALAAALVCTLAFGSFPALRMHAENLAAALKDGGRGAAGGRSRNRVRHALVMAQVALAMVLLVGSGLMLRSFANLRNVDPGFDPAGGLSMLLSLPEVDYPSEADVSRFVLDVTGRIESLPGVVAAGTTSRIGLIGGGDMDGIEVEDFPQPADGVSFVHPVRVVSPSFFAAMGVPLIEGRALNRNDSVTGAKVAAVSEAFAENFWPEGSAIGKRVTGSFDRGDWYTIVGVVGSIRERNLQDPPGQTIYLPLRGHNYLRPSISLVVRAEQDPIALLPAVREQIWEIDADLAISDVITLRQLVAESMSRTTFTMAMLGIAGVVALLLGTIGIYGVVAYVVGQRTAEIGVRMALGAQAREVSGMVVRQGLAMVVFGVVLGAIGAAGVTRLMTAVLFGVEPIDPLTFGLVPVLLMGAGALACLLPARRAAAVDPSVALRSQ